VHGMVTHVLLPGDVFDLRTRLVVERTSGSAP
jgi:hypothetical protein